MTQQLRQTVSDYLKKRNTMTLATSKNGLPWAASVFYASDSLTLYFLSDPETRHSQNIAANPAVSTTINGDPDDWREIDGVQMEGVAGLVEKEEELARAVSLYVARFPFTATYLKLIMSPLPRITSYLDEIIRKLPFAPRIPATPSRFYRVAPQWVRFIDNRQGFGNKEEMEV